MKGQKVIVRGYGGKPLIRILCEITDKAIFVSLKNINTLESMGFPKEDVFKYDTELAATMEDVYKNGKWNWNKLVPLTTDGNNML